MRLHGPTPQPDLHRPETPEDYLKPHPVVADEPGEHGAARAGIKDSDKLAELAGVDPEALAQVKDQEWRDRR